MCFSWVCGGRHFLCTKYGSYLECPCKSSLCILSAFLFSLYAKIIPKDYRVLWRPSFFLPKKPLMRSLNTMQLCLHLWCSIIVTAWHCSDDNVHWSFITQWAHAVNHESIMSTVLQLKNFCREPNLNFLPKCMLPP